MNLTRTLEESVSSWLTLLRQSFRHQLAMACVRTPLVIWLALLLALPSVAISAQTDTPPVRPTQNHYLLVVETSRTMQRRSQGVSTAVKDLLDSNLKAQLRPGDTLGVWTFNEDLDTSVFTSQEWSPENHEALSIRLVSFIQTRKYEKRASFQAVLPQMLQVIKQSPFVTIILVTSGEGEMSGTGFDTQINDTASKWRDEQAKARLPLLTLLRAKSGKVTDWSVTPAQWPMEFPPLPPELLQARAKAPAHAEVRPVAEPTVGAQVTQPDKRTASTQSAPRVPPAPNPTTPKSEPPVPSVAKSPLVEKVPTPSSAQASKSTAVQTNKVKLTKLPQLVSPTVIETVPHASPALSTNPISSPPPMLASQVPTPKQPQVVPVLPEPAPQTPDDRLAYLPPLAVSNASAGNASKVQPAPENQPQPPAKPQPAGPPPVVKAETRPTESALAPAPGISQPAAVRSSPVSAQPASTVQSASPTTSSASAAPPPLAATAGSSESFLRENARWLLLMALAGVCAVACFLKWVNSYLKPRIARPAARPLVSQAPPAPPQPGDEPANSAALKP